MRHSRLELLAVILLVLLQSACGSAKPRPEAFTSAEQAMDAAIRAGAEQHSPVELRFAREKLAEAREGMDLRQYDKALYLIEQSEINSELAIEKSRAAIVRARVAELSQENELLRERFSETFGEQFE